MEKRFDLGEIMMPKQQKKINLDKTDKIILQTLIENSRTPASQIAKNVNLTKASVIKRIENMIKNNIIYNFMPITNPFAWDYKLFSVFIRLDLISLEKDLEKLKSINTVWALFFLEGTYNVLVLFCEKDFKSFINTWNKVETNLNVKNLKINELYNYDFVPYNLLDVETKLDEKKEKSPKTEDLTAEDIKILDAIRFDARASLISLSNKIGISHERIKRRLDHLYKRGAIHCYFTNFDIFSLGFIPYLITFKTNDISEKLKDYLLKSKYTNGIYSICSEWQLMIIAEFLNIKELRDFIEEITQKFPEIKEYETHLLLDQHVCDLFPKGIQKKLLNK